MDRERFGRALGQGTREAARALLKAADAAAAPSPSTPARERPVPSREPIARAAAQTAAQATHRVRTTKAGLKQGSKRFGRAVWGPFAKLSGILWLEVTGVLFSLFAIVAALEVWRHRADLHATGAPRQHLFGAILMLALFGYFTISSFLRASRRSRR
jgi:hypothetical protein